MEKEQWNYKTNKQKQNTSKYSDSSKLLQSNNYSKCEWTELSNQKTQSGWIYYQKIKTQLYVTYKRLT